jgi:hypothetical protein
MSGRFDQQRGYHTGGSQPAQGYPSGQGSVPPYSPGPNYAPHAPYPIHRFEKPNRAGLVLAFGLMAWMVCPVFGIASWIMAKNDLAEMRAGVMDPSAEGLTKAGYWLGLLSVACYVLMFAVAVLVALLMSAGGPF